MDIPCFVITCIIYSKFRPLCLLSFFLCSCGTQANSWRNQKLAESHPPAPLAGASPEVYEEGNLERKHEWESSARKSSDRSWYSLFVVLRGGMFYSYKDQKQAKQVSCNAFCVKLVGVNLWIYTVYNYCDDILLWNLSLRVPPATSKRGLQWTCTAILQNGPKTTRNERTCFVSPFRTEHNTCFKRTISYEPNPSPHSLWI